MQLLSLFLNKQKLLVSGEKLLTSAEVLRLCHVINICFQPPEVRYKCA